MARFEDIQRAKAEQERRFEPAFERIQAVLVAKDYTDRADVRNRPGWVWYRRYDQPGNAAMAINRAVPSLPGLPVIIQRTRPTGEWEVVTWNAALLAQMDNYTGQNLTTHAAEHEPGGRDPLYVYLRMLVPFRTTPAGGLKVNIAPFTYEYSGALVSFPGYNNYDLTGSVPADGLAGYFLIYLDPATNSLNIKSTSTVVDSPAIEPPKPAPPDGAYLSAYVRLAGGQTEITETDIVDARMILGQFNRIYQASEVVFTPTGAISSTNVQSAIEELDAEKAPLSHQHTAADIDSETATSGQVLAADGTGGASWQDVASGGGAVDSVFGRTGDVIAQPGDYDASQVNFTPAGGIAATDVQAAIEELDTEKSPLSHTHVPADISPQGAGSGLDADSVDGQHASAFAPVFHPHDHGELAGLSDDDHPQYLNNARGDVRYLGINAKAADSDKLDGWHANTACNDFTGSRIPVRHPSGYLYTNYLNMSANNQTATPSRVAVEQNNDGFLRWQTFDQFKANLGSGSFRGFSAYRTTTQTIPATTTTKITFDAERFDTHGEFDIVNNQFVPLISGYWLVSLLIRYESGNSNLMGQARLDVNGVLTAYYIQKSDLGYYPPVQIHKVLYLNAGDVVEAYAWHSLSYSIGLNVTIERGYFSAAYLGE